MEKSWEGGNLEGVAPRLAEVVRRAHEVCPQAFCVFDGKRTQAEQAEFLKRGVTSTTSSRHLTGEAVDLVPLVGGKAVWEWSLIYPIAEAMRTAAMELGVTVRWGGCWGALNGTVKSPQELVADYVKSRKARGRSAFIDGPHYELA